MILTGTPDSLCAARFDVPVELERIVFRCLSKKRDDRFADMAELRAALSALSTSLSVHLPSSSFLPVTARDGSPPSGTIDITVGTFCEAKQGTFHRV